jgi:hypothetical protein
LRGTLTRTTTTIAQLRGTVVKLKNEFLAHGFLTDYDRPRTFEAFFGEVS